MTRINRVRTVRDIWTIRPEVSYFVRRSGVEWIVPASIDFFGRRYFRSAGRFRWCGLREGDMHKSDEKAAENGIFHEVRCAIRLHQGFERTNARNLTVALQVIWQFNNMNLGAL